MWIWIYLTDYLGNWLDVTMIVGEALDDEYYEYYDSIEEASDFEEAYNAAMEVFYRLDHHQMIYMEEWFDMGIEQFTVWSTAGEEFGVVFITEGDSSFGSF